MALDMGGDQSLSRRAMKAELLDAETELRLAYAWRDERDEEALHRLVTAYMRLAISMAAKFKRYGAPMNDLIQEAGLGLMKAADKFDPDRGVRFSTYAVWWIKASIQDYVMRNWSMVRTGSTSSQKSLFFNMRRVQARLEREAMANGETLDKHQLRQMIATEVGVPLHDVEMMEGRLRAPTTRSTRRSRSTMRVGSGSTRWKTTANRPPRRWSMPMTWKPCAIG
jgi:RNA polymerase sigma-32 factor